MAGFTNRGKYRTLEATFRGDDTFYVALVTSADAPGPDTNTLGDLTQIATGNGYADGGYELTGNGTDFDTLTEDDSNDRGLIQIKDVAWTASGGAIPASGGGARYAVLTDDNATVASREVLAYWDLSSDRSVSSGDTLTLQDLELRINES
jgi:hypothetical protein